MFFDEDYIFFNEKVLGSMFKILDDNIVVLFINILFIRIF